MSTVLDPLQKVLLAFPTILNLKDIAEGAAPRSWVQLARTGQFVSKRYGKFSITRDDLSQMQHNFDEVTPKAPTELPIDYDHLSMDPKRPGDGAAAGWMKKLELRDGGDTLWAQVEWTDDGADRVRTKQYRFISPSFVKDHTHKDGKKIGTTLLAAAITNHPFLEGMRAVTLNAEQLGDFALSEAEEAAVEDGAVSLSTIGQHVSIEQADELTPEERAMTFIISDVRGEGDDAFVFLKTLTGGLPFGWFRAEQCAPARSTMGSPIPPDRAKQEEMTMSDKQNAELIALSTAIAREEGKTLGDATKAAGGRRKDLADAWHGVKTTTDDDADAQTRPIINLHDGESFFMLCQRVSAERQIHLSQAIRMVSAAHPQLAEAYGRGEF